LPQAAFLFSIAGLSLSLAGFSGLVAAFKRGAPLNPIDAFRLRELPEMALATTFLAVLTIPLIDALHNEWSRSRSLPAWRCFSPSRTC